MRRAAKVDANQSDIVAALRAIGCSVQPLHGVGEGCPDLLVGWRNKNVLLEIKDGDQSPSRRRLTDDQVEWHADWRGQVAIVESIDEALAVMAKLSA